MGRELGRDKWTLLGCRRKGLFLDVGCGKVTGSSRDRCKLGHQRRFFRKRRAKELLNRDLLHHRMGALFINKRNETSSITDLLQTSVSSHCFKALSAGVSNHILNQF